MKKLLLFILPVGFSSIIVGQDTTTGKINEGLINCVVHVTIPAISSKDNKFGTGFLLGTKEKNRCYLVTNKHMLGKWNYTTPFSPFDSIMVDFYPTIKTKPIVQKTIKLKTTGGLLSSNVILHPNPKVDVALINISDIMREKGNSDIIFHRTDTNFLVRTSSLKELKISYASQVFAIGYPANLKIAGSNLPIAKSGYVASSTAGDFTIDVVDRSGRSVVNIDGMFYLVDGLIIGGNSGGPVVSTNQYDVKISKRLVTGMATFSLIVGIVSGGWENTGLSIIYACDNILDLVIYDINTNQR